MENIETQLISLRHILADLRSINKDGSLIIQQGEYQEILIDAVVKQIEELNSLIQMDNDITLQEAKELEN